ncbi:hypothetical protein JTB14_005497 [Gonioctena quinquepunctata]|nr:hypothetical protein JTB14_005497 [Gonioctena quinquepunctata]
MRNLKDTGIAVAHDSTLTEQKTNRILKRHLRRERETQERCFIKRNELKVGNTIYTVDDLLQLEANEATRPNIELSTPSRQQDPFLPATPHSSNGLGISTSKLNYRSHTRSFPEILNKNHTS